MKRSKHHHHKRCSTWWCLRSVISKWCLQTFNQEMHCFQFQTIILKAQKKATTFVHDKIMSLCHWFRYNYCKAIKMNSNFRVAHFSRKFFGQNCSIKTLRCEAVFFLNFIFIMWGHLLLRPNLMVIYRDCVYFTTIFHQSHHFRRWFKFHRYNFSVHTTSQNCSKFMRLCQARKLHETSIKKVNYPFHLNLGKKKRNRTEYKYPRFTRNVKVKLNPFL